MKKNYTKPTITSASINPANFATTRLETITIPGTNFGPIDYFKTLKVWYYINTNNGGTEFANGDFAKSVANRAVIVDGNIEHQTVGQTDADVRLIININYME